jgi:hypothetical protein
MDKRPLPSECCCAASIRELIRAEIDYDRQRAAKEEASLWDRAFGPAAPADHKRTGERIIHTASIRAFLTFLHKRP